jgi:hypothetical protein
LSGDGACAPSLDMVVAQDLCLELGGNGHRSRPYMTPKTTDYRAFDLAWLRRNGAGHVLAPS